MSLSLTRGDSPQHLCHCRIRGPWAENGTTPLRGTSPRGAVNPTSLLPPRRPVFITVRNRRRPVRALAAAAGLALAAIGIVLPAHPAAATTTYEIVGTGGIGVRARVAPTVDADWDYGPPEGARVSVLCQVVGEPLGAYDNDLWFYVSYDGREFFVPDAYTNSPHMADDPPLAGIDMCRAVPPAAPPVLDAQRRPAGCGFHD